MWPFKTRTKEDIEQTKHLEAIIADLEKVIQILSPETAPVVKIYEDKHKEFAEYYEKPLHIINKLIMYMEHINYPFPYDFESEVQTKSVLDDLNYSKNQLSSIIETALILASKKKKLTDPWVTVSGRNVYSKHTHERLVVVRTKLQDKLHSL